MTRNVVAIDPQQTLNEAVLLLYDNHVSCLPVVNKQNKPVGIITWRDLLKVLALKYRKKIRNKLETNIKSKKNLGSLSY